VKTPREILLERHRSAAGKLDAIRQSMLAQNAPAETAPLSTRLIRELLLPLRWHLAGIAAAWVVVASLNADQISAPVTAGGEAGSSPRQLIVVLAENRRQLVEMIEPAAMERPAPPQPLIPGRRSAAPPTSALV
jgi:hypothetical protein